jgi:DNA-binding NtrC family response regulator
MCHKEKIHLNRKILLIDDAADFRWITGNVLRDEGYQIMEAEDGKQAFGCLRREIPDLILLDYRMPGGNGLEVAAEIMKIVPDVPIVMVTAYGDIRSAVSAMKIGVYDYMTKPVDNNDLLFTIKRALQSRDLSQEVERLRSVLGERESLYELMGRSDRIQNMVELVEKVAPTPFTVLIEGESGSGKELVARALHRLSGPGERPFVAVDCGSIPETLIESELFGYVKGAFTGAVQDKPGQFELADGGDLFLDEVGNLSHVAQQKLLRALQERVVQRLGAKKARPVNVRVLAATNRSLEKDVEEEMFRSDLYFRLREFVIRVPALRERIDDIPYMAFRFAEEAQAELNKTIAGFSREAVHALVSHSWPGNVRELKNVIRQAVLLAEKDMPIGTEHLFFGSASPGLISREASLITEEFYDGESSLREIVRSATQDLEKKIIRRALMDARGNKSMVARRLEVDYKTLLRKIKKLGIENEK